AARSEAPGRLPQRDALGLRGGELAPVFRRTRLEDHRLALARTRDVERAGDVEELIGLCGLRGLPVPVDVDARVPRQLGVSPAVLSGPHPGEDGTETRRSLRHGGAR